MIMKALLKYAFIMALLPTIVFAQSDVLDADIILEKIDENMSSVNRVVESDMVIHGRRRSRTITSKSFAEGDNKSMTEYLAPAREEGTKMLKIEDQLWIYSPTSDRIILISGHMLKQSVMGSDLSYEDMMEDRKLTDIYDAKVIREEEYESRRCWVVEMNAIVADVSYQKRMVWVDQDRFIPLKEELFAKSGQLLKKTTLSDAQKVENRWFPMKINYKDMLKDGKGTDYVIKEIKFDVEIPAHIFTKASLSK
jgi:outer membrane lipoprotein-sorting protein